MYSCFNSIIHFKGSITICFSASIPSISFIIFSCKIRFTSFSFPFYSIEILFFKSKIFISFPLPCIFPFKYEPLNINFPYLVKSLALLFLSPFKYSSSFTNLPSKLYSFTIPFPLFNL